MKDCMKYIRRNLQDEQHLSRKTQLTELRKKKRLASTLRCRRYANIGPLSFYCYVAYFLFASRRDEMFVVDIFTFLIVFPLTIEPDCDFLSHQIIPFPSN